MAQKTIIDYLADNVSPYMVVACIPLGYYSKTNTCVYALFFNICFLFLIGMGKLGLTIVRHSWHIKVLTFISQYVTGTWIKLLMGIDRIKQYWVGKVMILFTSLALAAHLILWTYWYINVREIFKNTLIFIKSIPQYILDAPKLFESMMTWLRTLMVGYVMDNINRYWDNQVEGTSQKNPAWIVIGSLIIITCLIIVFWLANFDAVSNHVRNIANQMEIAGNGKRDDSSSESDDKRRIRSHKNKSC